MINKEEIIRQLTASAEAIRAMLASLSDEQAQWKPDAETWSMREVMYHVYNEERIDFRKHLREMFHDPPQAWAVWREEDMLPIASCRQGLQDFLSEREASIAWLRSLKSPDWEIVSQAPWGAIRAGDVLVSWAEHDYLHMRQMNELLHAWNAAQGAPYSVQYGGGW